MTHSGPTTFRPRPAAPGAAPARRAAGFTLLELLISIALVLVLMLGINQVFKITSDSIGAAQGLTANIQSNRALQAVLYQDMAQSIIKSPESPCLVINSTWVSAFLDRNDELSDLDYAAAAGGTPNTVDTAIRSIDVDDNNVEGEPDLAGIRVGENIPRNQFGRRSFRTDQLTFFARHL